MNNFKPHIGSNLEAQNSQVELRDESYANLNSLRRDLSHLISAIDGIEASLSEELDQLAIQIDQADTRMVQAHQQEWPFELGEPSDQISYGYYKTLALSTSSAAAYLRQKFEEAVRDMTGSPALDLFEMCRITKQEALLIQDFLTRYIVNAFDSSEKRVIEILQDWTESAMTNVKKISRYVSKNESEDLLPPEVIDSVPPSEARQAQATFKIKMNTFNDEIAKNLDFLKRNFSRHSEVFYDRFLGNALDMRTKVSRKKFPRPNSPIDTEMKISSEILDDDLKNVISDEVRRKNIYHQNMEKLQIHVKERDKYRDLVKQLSTKGKQLPTSGSNVVVQSQDSEEQRHHWQRSTQVVNDSTQLEPLGSLKASHSNLRNLDNKDDHPQYLLRSGGEMTGHIELAEDIRVGGIIPSKHRHTGVDGSAQVHSSNIIENTLRPELVDLSQKPPTPIDLQIDEYDPDVIPPGIARIDTDLSWEGFQEETFEVQIVRVGKKAEEIEEPVLVADPLFGIEKVATIGVFQTTDGYDTYDAEVWNADEGVDNAVWIGNNRFMGIRTDGSGTLQIDLVDIEQNTVLDYVVFPNFAGNSTRQDWLGGIRSLGQYGANVNDSAIFVSIDTFSGDLMACVAWDSGDAISTQQNLIQDSSTEIQTDLFLSPSGGYPAHPFIVSSSGDHAFHIFATGVETSGDRLLIYNCVLNPDNTISVDSLTISPILFSDNDAYFFSQVLYPSSAIVGGKVELATFFLDESGTSDDTFGIATVDVTTGEVSNEIRMTSNGSATVPGVTNPETIWQANTVTLSTFDGDKFIYIESGQKGGHETDHEGFKYFTNLGNNIMSDTFIHDPKNGAPVVWDDFFPDVFGVGNDQLPYAYIVLGWADDNQEVELTELGFDANGQINSYTFDPILPNPSDPESPGLNGVWEFGRYMGALGNDHIVVGYQGTAQHPGDYEETEVYYVVYKKKSALNE